MTAARDEFPAAISEQIWDLKYRLRAGDGAPVDRTLEDTFRRVAKAASEAETGGDTDKALWEERFFEAISDFGFLPAGRIFAGADSGRSVTLFNCFVMGPVPDDLGGIFESVKEAALTLQSGGGIGVDFSSLRPRGSNVKSIGADASGPVSFMDVWDSMCRTIMSAGARRGAMMATLRADHPDIESFVDAKSVQGKLTNFNLSVLVPDTLVDAVEGDRDWDLKFDGKIYRTIRARDLWDRIMQATYSFAEPGVIFIDRINQQNNLAYCETICTTNPCGEQPLPPYGACLLGSINLTRFVTDPFEPDASLDLERVQERVHTAVRLLDNLIDVSNYPLDAQRAEAIAKRRIGLGVTGLADALAMCGLTYGSAEAVRAAGEWMATIQRAAYLASTELATAKGAFPLFDAKAFLKAPGVKRLPKDVRKAIKRHGIRNGCLTSIAPTGTISLLAGNISSGIEPIFDVIYERRMLSKDGRPHTETVANYAADLYWQKHGKEAELPDVFVTAEQLTPEQHLAMQASIQAHVDSSISKTINCAKELSFDDFKNVYRDAFALGLKGCTTYRPNIVRGAVLAHVDKNNEDEVHAASAPNMDGAAGGTSAHSLSMRAEGDHGDVVYLSQPLQREGVLHGSTYKLKWPASEQAIYITINDTVHGGRRRPFEIFINSRNLEHYSWTVALTRMISAVFRRGGDVSFVAEELKAIFDPLGGYWTKGRYVPSLLAAIGDVIEQHLNALDVNEDDAPELRSQQQFSRPAEASLQGAPLGSGADPPYSAGSVVDPQGAARIKTMAEAAFTGSDNRQMGTQRSGAEKVADTGRGAGAAERFCPRCSSPDYVREEGCWVCRQCLYSRCG